MICYVDRNLDNSLSFQINTYRFDVPEPSAGESDCPGYFSAIFTSHVPRFTLKAMRNSRAPTAVTPAVGCTRSGPKSGFHRGSFIFSKKPSNSPLLISARFCLSGRVADFHKDTREYPVPLLSCVRVFSNTPHTLPWSCCRGAQVV